jgi:hypothetical protein
MEFAYSFLCDRLSVCMTSVGSHRTIFLKRQKCTPSPAGTAGGGQGGLSGLGVDRVVSQLGRECAARLPRAARPPHQAIAKWIAAANVAGGLGYRALTGPERFKASTYNSIGQGFTPDAPRPRGPAGLAGESWKWLDSGREFSVLCCCGLLINWE